MKRYLILVSLILLPIAANAAKQYDIELIAFQHPQGGQSEYWSSEPGEPDRLKAKHILFKNTRDTTTRFGDDVSTLAVPQAHRTLLTKEQQRMGPIAYTLRKKGYPVPLHIAWRQPVKGWKSNDWNWVETDNLKGLIRITRGKFLHLDIDLLLTDQQSGQQYRIQVTRKMRSDEIHHIDHPKLGFIVRADRWIPPESVEETKP